MGSYLWRTAWHPRFVRLHSILLLGSNNRGCFFNIRIQERCRVKETKNIAHSWLHIPGNNRIANSTIRPTVRILIFIGIVLASSSNNQRFSSQSHFTGILAGFSGKPPALRELRANQIPMLEENLGLAGLEPAIPAM